MIARALDAGVPCDWVLGDEVCGADRRLRMMLEARGRPYLLAIRGNDRLWSELDGRVGQHAPAALARAPPRPALVLPPRPALVLAWSVWRRAHQAVAQAFHYRRRFRCAEAQL